MSRLLIPVLCSAGLLFSSACKKNTTVSNGPGIEVTVRVLDEAGAPVGSATVRHPDEADPHPVNVMSGAFAASVLYMPDGRELIFEKDLQLTFEISAAGYVNQEVLYTVKKRNNQVTVVLEKMNLDIDDDDDAVIGFGRDKPIDGRN